MTLGNIQYITPSVKQMQFSNTYEKSIKTSTQIENTSLAEIGLVLKETRKKKSYTLRDIRLKTQIPLYHITAIESGKRELLPEDVFLTGFLKRYARALGLNEQIILERYVNGNKTKSLDSKSDAFDSLFHKENASNAIHIKPVNTPPLFSYLCFFITVLFLSFASYFIFQIFGTTSENQETAQYMEFKGDNSISFAGTDNPRRVAKK